MRATVGRIYWTARFLGWAVPQPVSQSATLRLLLTLEAGVEWTKCSSSSMIMDYHTFGTIKMLLGQNKRRKGWRSQRWITPACFASSLDRLDRRRPTPFPYLERRERRGPARWNLCCKNISSGADRPSSTGRVQQRFPIRLVAERKVHIRSRALDPRKLAGLQSEVDVMLMFGQRVWSPLHQLLCWTFTIYLVRLCLSSRTQIFFQWL